MPEINSFYYLVVDSRLFELISHRDFARFFFFHFFSLGNEEIILSLENVPLMTFVIAINNNSDI